VGTLAEPSNDRIKNKVQAGRAYTNYFASAHHGVPHLIV
jgi:hypothetical protein